MKREISDNIFNENETVTPPDKKRGLFGKRKKQEDYFLLQEENFAADYSPGKPEGQLRFFEETSPASPEPEPAGQGPRPINDPEQENFLTQAGFTAEPQFAEPQFAKPQFAEPQLLEQPFADPPEQMESEPLEPGAELSVFDLPPESPSLALAHDKQALPDTDAALPPQTAFSQAEHAPAAVQIGQDKVLTLLQKPEILLETPYVVHTKGGGQTVRYRLEFGHPDKAVPSEEMSMTTGHSDPQDKKEPMDTAPLERSKRQSEMLRKTWEWAKVLVAAVLIALVIRTFVLVFVWVDGDSMRDTLHNREYMLVTRIEYYFSSPKRQDIIICYFEGESKSVRFVKRIIGLPGDTVEIREGAVLVNGQALVEDYIKYPKKENIAPFTVPQGQYFVMGDNRANSRDSRIVGCITREDIIGHVQLVVWPLNQIKSVD